MTEAGIPVVGHLGLTPQSVHQLGGYKVQGKEQEKARPDYKEAAQAELDAMKQGNFNYKGIRG